MKRSPCAVMLVLVGLVASKVRALEIQGPSELRLFTQQVVASCSGASGLAVAGGTNDGAEARLAASTQQVAPLYGRFLDATTCDGPLPDEADGLLIGLDALVVAVDSDSSAACGVDLAASATISVADLNGVPGLQCPGCAGSSYQLSSFRDALRILFAGMPEGQGDSIATRDCNSDLRRSLVEHYANLFETGCTGSGCGVLRHAFRPPDGADSTDLLLSLLGLPDSPSPFCNVLQDDSNAPGLTSCARDSDCPAFDCNESSGKCASPKRPYFPEFQDNDPIRRPCAGTGNLPAPPFGTAGGPPPNEPTEQVCGRDGTLGLVLPVHPPLAGVAAPTPYPVKDCHKGRFVLGDASFVETIVSPPPPKTIVDRCPNGDRTAFGGCLIPAATDLDPACINGKNNLPAFVLDSANATATDGRVYNRYLRKGGAGPDKGAFATIPRPGFANADIVGAFYRLHGTRSLDAAPTTGVCILTDPARATGCLAKASPCSAGLAANRAGQTPGTRNLGIGGIEPFAANIRRLLTPGDPLVYPLSTRVYFGAVRGLDKVTTLPEWHLGQCMKSKNKVQAAATFSGLVTLEADPSCTDYDERECGFAFNADACNDGANLCPSIGIFSVSPTQTSVGGVIHVAATGTDPDGGWVTFSWTATSGSFANAEAPSTTYTCTTAGQQTLTLTIADSQACTDEASFGVSCL